MSGFQVGDVVIIQNQVGEYAHFNGIECTVIEDLAMRVGSRHGRFLCYRIDLISPAELGYLVRPTDIRHKQPPMTDQSTARQAMLDCIQRAMQPQGVVI